MSIEEDTVPLKAGDEGMTTRAPILRIPREGKGVEHTVPVATETVLTLDVAGVGAYTLMCSPSDFRALAVGFLFSEGLIENLDDIHLIVECPDDPNVIRIKVAEKRGAPARGRLLVVSGSCGICGGREQIRDFLRNPPSVGDSLRVTPDLLESVHSEMTARQETHRLTSGTHAAAVFDEKGNLICFAEDTGRHNALDKVIGKLVIQGHPMRGLGVAMSSRTSFELAAKAARAGFEILAGVSAPSSLAIEAARSSGLTVFQFLRKGFWAVYSNPHRIIASDIKDTE